MFMNMERVISDTELIEDKERTADVEVIEGNVDGDDTQ